MKHFSAHMRPSAPRTWYTSAKFPERGMGMPSGPVTTSPARRSGSEKEVRGFWTASLYSWDRGHAIRGTPGYQHPTSHKLDHTQRYVVVLQTPSRTGCRHPQGEIVFILHGNERAARERALLVGFE